MDSSTFSNYTGTTLFTSKERFLFQEGPVRFAAFTISFILLGILFCAAAPRSVTKLRREFYAIAYPYLKFAYVSFFKPHSGDSSGSQQAALESFYKIQADVYDVTRRALLRGREDMLSLAVAQLKFNDSQKESSPSGRRIWVDIGGGTGYNIEAMSAFVSVPDFFSKVYLVDFSPSLCEIARKRFDRLGWKNVHVICQDARLFRLEEYELSDVPRSDEKDSSIRPGKRLQNSILADLVTMSYSLSMIPDYHSIIDSSTSLLAPSGIICVVDFYVQSIADVTGKTYVGGTAGRHVNWISRAFWRAWFEADRVNLDASRRDYLEYRFGTMLSYSDRNYRLGGIPYYLWLGKQKSSSTLHSQASTADSSRRGSLVCPDSISIAQHNLSIDLPLPPAFYQNQPWRLQYREHHSQHTQFSDAYIYAFTWEDPKIDESVLNIGPEDEIVAITSAGDNILAYLARPESRQPKEIHAVDLNPSQNHLLELKLAAFASLEQSDIWKLFGLGHHPRFREILLRDLSPHLSSCAFQFWLARHDTFSQNKGGLYSTGGSRHALSLVKWLARLRRAGTDIRNLCKAPTIEKQIYLWESRVRRLLVNRALNWAIISQRLFLWKALGVPNSQREMIVNDHIERNGGQESDGRTQDSAICRYMTETLDPVIRSSKLCTDNYFYLLCLQGHYNETCHPKYLSPSSYPILSSPTTLSKITIHTSPLLSVLKSRKPSSLAAAVIMDSMDWFPSTTTQQRDEACEQIDVLFRALRPGGKVLLRSAARRPWYLKLFAERGFEIKCVCVRGGDVGKGEKEFVDRVNMYAGTWLCVKT